MFSIEKKMGVGEGGGGLGARNSSFINYLQASVYKTSKNKRIQHFWNLKGSMKYMANGL